MKILRRDRSGDLIGPNSPYRTERIAYWTWQCIRHPLSTPNFLLRHTTAWLKPDSADINPLWVYGDPDRGVPLYTGVDLPYSTIYGNSDTLRHLANVLLRRADHYDLIADMYARGQTPTRDQLSSDY